VADAWRGFSGTKFYDLLAAAPVILWYALSAWHMLPAFAAKLAKADWTAVDLPFAVSLLAQGAGIVLIATATAFLLLRRPPKAKAKGLLPRFAAFAGTYLGVAVVWLPARPMSVPLSLASLGLILLGTGFAVFALAHLGRSFSLMAEARRLVTNGPYAALRHPLYLGEAVSMIGLTLQYLSPLAVLIAGLQIAFQLVRMKNEEAVLAGMFPEYGAYAARTARLLPGLY
jgi:protein-S-isoprenylcysteine O-methyltransferase Ste14